MSEYGPSTYGDRIANVYDGWFGVAAQDTGGAVDCLAELAQGGPVLELGIGTGRIALPLAERGIEVQGIDASEAMIAKLRAKEGGNAIRVLVDDFANVGVEGKFALIFVAYSTFFALGSQDDQVRCFANVARRLVDNGVFVVDAFVPDLTRWVQHQAVRAGAVTADRVFVEVSQHDPVAQRVISKHVVISENGTRLYPVEVRYAWPSELDLMARLAGLRLRSRWSDWHRGEFAADSNWHISVYEKASEA